MILTFKNIFLKVFLLLECELYNYCNLEIIYHTASIIFLSQNHFFIMLNVVPLMISAGVSALVIGGHGYESWLNPSSAIVPISLLFS